MYKKYTHSNKVENSKYKRLNYYKYVEIAFITSKYGIV